MEWAAGRNGTGGLDRVAAGLPARPAEGAALARARLEYRGVHQAPEAGGPRWVVDPAVLRRVRDGACRGFSTVLSPEYNAAHRDHFHFDMAGRWGGVCR